MWDTNFGGRDLTSYVKRAISILVAGEQSFAFLAKVLLSLAENGKDTL